MDTPTLGSLGHTLEIASTCKVFVLPCNQPPQQYISFGLGIAATLLFCIALLPQILKNYQRSTCDGLSFGLIFIWTLGDVTNYLGTLFTDQLSTQRFTGIYFLATDIALVGQYIYYTRYYVPPGEDAPLVERRVEEEVILDPSREDRAASGPSEHTPLLSSSAEAPGDQSISDVDDGKLSLTQKLTGAFGVVFCLFLVVLLDNIIARLAGGGNWERDICDAVGVKDGVFVILGNVMAWCSGILYFWIPQIIENFQAKSVEGLSLALFVITIIGNFCYGMSILFRLPVIDQQFYLGTLPYLIGSMGTICFDCVILGQACLYGTAWRRMQDEDE